MRDYQCKKCDGSGWIPLEATMDDSNPDWHLGSKKACECQTIKPLRQYLGDVFADSPMVRSSPLYSVTQNCQAAATDRTTDHLVLTGSWSTVETHIKFALVSKWLVHLGTGLNRMTFRIVTDRQLKTSHFADRNNDGARKGDRVERLDQLLGPEHGLVILRLGFLGGAYSEMPELLLSVMRERVEMAKRPLWIIVDPKYPLKKGMVAWSESVEAYVDERFGKVALT